LTIGIFMANMRPYGRTRERQLRQLANNNWQKLLRGKESQMAQAYCFRCRAKREIKNAEPVLLKNNRLGLKGVCPVCGGKVFRIDKRWPLPG